MKSDLKDLLKNNAVILESKSLVKKIYLENNLPWVIGFSGGKDSTATLQLIVETLIEMSNENLKLNKKIHVISSNTLIENPMIIDTIHRSICNINKLSKELNLNISAHIIEPSTNNTFFVNLIGKGYPPPNQTFRWCTDRLKIEPANNFVNSIVDQHGEIIMVLGVRNGESNSRDRVLDNHSIKGKDLMIHTTMKNAYVFAPIKNFNLDNVWNYLLSNPSPWGVDNNELFSLYSESNANEECPLILDTDQKRDSNCGNSRFGCWMCTVVRQDKSLTGFIKSGHFWLNDLLEYRNWVYEIRDDADMRMKRRTNGTIYFSKIKCESDGHLVIPAKGLKEKNNIKKNETNNWIDSKGEEWIVFTERTAEADAKNYIINNNIDLTNSVSPNIIIKNIDGSYSQLALGPFTFDTRKEMLRRLLILERDLNKGTLISIEEINQIRKLWSTFDGVEDTARKIYEDVYVTDSVFINDDINIPTNEEFEIIQSICNENNFNINIYLELLHNSKVFAGFKNRNDSVKKVKKIFNKEFLLLEGNQEDEN